MEGMLQLGIIIFISLFGIFLFLLTWWRRSDPKLNALRQRLIIVDSLFGNIPVEKSNSSYTDKRVIYVCAQDRDGRYYDDNTLIGVLLHEMAHVRTPFIDVNHKSEVFKRNESILLRKAQLLGLWNPKILVPCDYCNVNMSGVACRRPIPNLKRFGKKW